MMDLFIFMGGVDVIAALVGAQFFNSGDRHRWTIFGTNVCHSQVHSQAELVDCTANLSIIIVWVLHLGSAN